MPNEAYELKHIVFLCAVVIRWCVSLHSYSGSNTPPMFGDYEAQRHWMEITYNLPISEWYKNSTDNNLQYWGLDYPPLTAYHSYLFGAVSSVFLPGSVDLHTSRGYESYHHKLFMRATVLFSDVMIFFPAVYLLFLKRIRIRERHTSSQNLMYVSLVLLYPGLILIDHGHFQYNCVSLGLFLLSVSCIRSKKHHLAAFLFCLALSYKQMELYHSLPFFVYFLRKFFHLWKHRSFAKGLIMLSSIAATVILTFISVWSPFIVSIDLVIGRMFPIARGIFEDKVSNFWCVANIFYKFRTRYSNEEMFRLCFLVTLISILPTLLNLFYKAATYKFMLSLINCSLAFYLFSFQVHEKSILLVAIPVMLYFPIDMLISSWFLIISTFSMLPLHIKDGLFLPYFSLTCIYGILSFYFWKNSSITKNKKHDVKLLAFCGSMFGILALSFITRFCPSPSRYPDIWPLIVSFYSFCHFAAFFLYFNYTQYKLKMSKNHIF